MYKFDRIVKNVVIDLLDERFASDVKIKSVLRLSSNERRNLILRIILESSSNGVPKTVIFKQSLHAKDSDDEQELLDRFARDWSGLEFVSSSNDDISFTPKFYGGSLEHRFILLEDLGDRHISLVDSLMENDKDMAVAALYRYMQNMAKLHINGHERSGEYEAGLKKISPNAKTWQLDLDEMISKTDSILEELGLNSSTDLHAEMRQIFNLMKEPGSFTTLIHGDICPDNVFDNPLTQSMHLIDFEWCYIGSSLLDATYLRMAMPTCWCVKAFPEDVIIQLDSLYRKALAKKIPEALDDDLYNEAYVSACGYRICTLLAYALKFVLDKDYDIKDPIGLDLHPKWKVEYNLGRPRYLYRLQTFIDIASKHDKLPHLINISKQVLQELKTRWPDTETLELFSAFIRDVK